MQSNEFLLILARSKDDAAPFSPEYQVELRQFSKKAHFSSQRGFAMDSAMGGGGPLGEFIFDHAEALITAVSAAGVAWLHGRFGRKLRIKYRDIEIEANTTKEVEAMVQQIRVLQGTDAPEREH